ncbi:PilW family protein [Ottowia testudinis]|uniref:PilW family protein n=1 Tax=Ottowia testudinis TaxID=2816950 RepID=A0A975H2D7_9BURK|nr:PilW family protein [Ottowia testudinis]QTD44763.1 PilW family protein [Ottowia testudinis]
MIGITLGLMVVAVGTGAILVSRNYSSTISDATQLQQQAAYAFRVIGQQARQAGSLELNLATNSADGSLGTVDPSDPVGFAVKYANFGQIISGIDAPGATEYSLTLGQQNYFEKQVDAAAERTLFRDCLGKGGGKDADENYLPVISRFALRNNSLMCAGVASTAGDAGIPQSLIQNVSDFQVRYHIQENTAGGNPTIKKVNAAGVTNWGSVFAIEVCLDMVGDQSIDLPSTSKYVNCSGDEVSYNKRIHQLFRNVYQIRSQGILS